MKALLTPFVHLLDSFDICSGFLLAVVLHIVASWCSHAREEIQQWAIRIGLAVFLTLLLGSLLRDGNLFLLITRVAQSGGLAWMTVSAAQIVLPPIALLNKTAFLRPRHRAQVGRHRKEGRLRTRQARIQEAQRRRREEEWEAGREAREAEAEEAARKAQEEAERKHAEQERREVARFDLKITFDRHYADIRESMPRKRFDEYLANELSDEYPAEIVEQRAEQMKQTILDFFETDLNTKQMTFLDEQLAELQEQRKQLEGKAVADELLEEITAHLNYEEDRLKWEKLQNE